MSDNTTPQALRASDATAPLAPAKPATGSLCDGASPYAGEPRQRTVEVIAAEIRGYTASMLVTIVEIGRRMLEAKALLPYGKFGTWIKEETGYSSSTANNFMRMYQSYAADQGCIFGAELDCQTFGKLSYSKALALLELPKEEREDFVLNNDVDVMSTREFKQAIREKQEAEKRASEAERALHELEESEGLAVANLEEQLDEAREKLRRAEAEARRAAEGVGPYRERAEEAEQAVAALREQVRELEARPVATVTVRDEAAIEEAVRAARAKAESDAAERLNDLQKKLAAATKAKEKAEKEARRAAEGVGPYKEKAEAAEKEAAAKVAAAEQEAAAARAALEDARKKLKASSANVTKFGVYFKSMQEDFNSACALLPEIGESDAETAEKLRKGMRVLVEKMLERIGE